MRRKTFFGQEALAPTSEKDYRRGFRDAFDVAGNAAPVDARHPEVGDHDGEWLALSASGGECVDSGLASACGDHFVAVTFQNFAEGADDERVVVHNENAHPFWKQMRRIWRRKISQRGGGDREDQSDRCAVARRAVNFEICAVALDDTVHHGEAEASAAFSFGSEKRFEAAAARFFVHAGAGVFYFD